MPIKKDMAHRAWIVAVWISYVVGSVCADFHLTILHTNDVHARFDQMSKYGGPCRPSDATAGKCYGGIARRLTAIRHIREEVDHVLLLDAGDQFQGTLWFYIHKGLAAAYFMNKLQYDAMAMGNHELDNGVAGLLPFLDQVEFPVLCCNVNTTFEPEIGKRLRSSVVFKVGEKRIGVVGYITRETKELSDTGKLIFLDEVESLRKQVSILKSAGVDIIIALSHAGYTMDLQVAKQVEDLDLIIGGHTDTFLYSGQPPSIEKPVDVYPKVVKQDNNGVVLVVQNYAFGKYLGRLDLTFDEEGHAIGWHGNPILLDNSIEQDPDMLEEMNTWREEVEEINRKVIGSSEVFLDGDKASCRLYECNMGNLVTNAMLYYYRNTLAMTKPVQAAIINSGAIRASLEKGNITLADIQMVQPFRNTFDVMEIHGRHLRAILEHSVAGYDKSKKHGRFLQVAGLRVLYDLSKPDGKKVKAVCIDRDAGNGNFVPLLDDEVYRVTVPSFLVEGGDGYKMIEELALKIDVFESLDLEVTMDYIQEHDPIDVQTEGRILFVGEGDSVKWRCQPLSMGLTSASRSTTVVISTVFYVIAAVITLVNLRG